MHNTKRIKRFLTGDDLEHLLMRKTSLDGGNIRVGCLPYSYHGRAKTSVDEQGNYHYTDWWGYEIVMLENLAKMENFRYLRFQFRIFCICISFSIVYDPPEDGLWGALEASGNMSGLIGQAAYGEVDLVVSGMMISYDRWKVADHTIFFDSDTMVFVSPPPKQKSKAVAPIMPFNIYVRKF